jgi:hypothetical protein
MKLNDNYETWDIVHKHVLEGTTSEIEGFTGLEGVTLKDGQWVILFASKQYVRKIHRAVEVGGNPAAAELYEFTYPVEYLGSDRTLQGALYVFDRPFALLYNVLPIEYTAFERIAVAQRFEAGRLIDGEYNTFSVADDENVREFDGSRWVRLTYAISGLGLTVDDVLVRYESFMSGHAIVAHGEEPWIEEEYDNEDNLIREQSGYSRSEPECSCLFESPEEMEMFEKGLCSIWLPPSEIHLIKELVRFGVTGPLCE